MERQHETELIIEVLLKKINSSKHELRSKAFKYLKRYKPTKTTLKVEDKEIEEITTNEIIRFSHPGNINTQYFFYTVHESGAEVETLEEGDSDEVPASQHWILPNREFQGLWENLIYESGLKDNILKFAKTIILFSQKGIDPNVISCNKLVLLHGPPGTGKTSLCKALAQKLSIQLQENFKHTHFFEINSHSLFSKWFSESGKLVLKLFSNIKLVAENTKSLIIVLIDEVESIAYARESVSASEPSDSLRVVNAVLTQLDQLRRYPNVLVVTTSNLTSTIDLAFVDRADLKQLVGHPSVEATYEIFRSAIDELMNVDIISPTVQLAHYQELFQHNNEEHESKESCALLQISKRCNGFSGRTLRKLPLLAHAWFIKEQKVDFWNYVEALSRAIKKNVADSQDLRQ